MYGNDGGYGQNRSYAPVKEGDEVDVQIEAVGEKGDGIAKKDGFVLFVPNTKEGDNVKVRITRVLKKVGFAEVVGQGASSSTQAVHAEEPQIEDTDDFGEEVAEEAPAEETPTEEADAPPEPEETAVEEKQE